MLGKKEFRRVRFDATKKSVLDGITVIDVSRLVAGNMLSLQLGDFGAEVIKVEPFAGDPLRDWRNNEKSLYWKTYCRNKRSIAMNLREPSAKEALLKLVEKSDVFIENYRPGTLEEMGIAPDVLLARNPDLVIVRISGFGQTGPYSQFPGFGTLIEAMSGFADRNGFEDREPVLPPLALGDMIAGVYGAYSTVVALLARERGKAAGQVIDLSLLEPLIATLGPEASIFRETGKAKKRTGSASNTACPRNVYLCGDNKYVALSGSTEAMARRVFEVLGRPEMAKDPRYSTNSARLKHRDEVDGMIGAWFATKTRDDAMAELRAKDVTVGPVYSIADIVQDDHFIEREVFVEANDTELGSVPMHNIVPRLSATPGTLRRPAPEFGEHTDQILSELGYDEAGIAELRTAKAVM